MHIYGFCAGRLISGNAYEHTLGVNAPYHFAEAYPVQLWHLCIEQRELNIVSPGKYPVPPGKA